ncbi:MAG: tRNA (N6-threonylcarbamoyladenosine(37)-N6)-methyltransferase TrmO [Thermodesulfobacteriota bacterium]
MSGQKTVTMTPIGFLRTDARDIPRHWSLSREEGTIAIDQEYIEGLSDMKPGQKIIVLFWFDRSPAFLPRYLRQTPPHRREPLGVFSVCSPRRPNPIGLSVLTVLDIQHGNIRVRGIDMLDGTPILDIKPYITEAEDCPSYSEEEA